MSRGGHHNLADETRKGRSLPAAKTGLSPLAELVRRHDRDRYLTALFAPAPRREALLALYAFNYEVARVRESVTQPMLGQIRLQWWRDAIAAAYRGEAPRQHEVVVPLTAAIREFGLCAEAFERLIDGRERDLDDAPPESLAALEAYAEATSATLVRLALEILGAGSHGAAGAAAADIGVAYALAGLLRAIPFHAREGRSYIPADIAAETGLDPRERAALRGSPAMRRAARAIAERAAARLAAGCRFWPQMPRAAIPALLPAVVARQALRRLRRAGYDPFAPSLAAPDPLLAWRLAVAAWSRRW